MTSFIVRVTRLRDGFELHTGFGSFEGCRSEARGIAGKLNKVGDVLHRHGEGTWSGHYSKIEVLPFTGGKIPELAWEPEEFTSKKLTGEA